MGSVSFSRLCSWKTKYASEYTRSALHCLQGSILHVVTSYCPGFHRAIVPCNKLHYQALRLLQCIRCGICIMAVYVCYVFDGYSLQAPASHGVPESAPIFLSYLLSCCCADCGISDMQVSSHCRASVSRPARHTVSTSWSRCAP